jgi:hypothetical protein
MNDLWSRRRWKPRHPNHQEARKDETDEARDQTPQLTARDKVKAGEGYGHPHHQAAEEPKGDMGRGDALADGPPQAAEEENPDRTTGCKR